MGQFERFVLYKLSVSQAGLDDSVFNDNHFQSVIGEVANSLTSNAVAAAIAMKFSALCQGAGNNRSAPLALIRDRLFKAHSEDFAKARTMIKQPETPFDVERIMAQKQPQQ